MAIKVKFRKVNFPNLLKFNSIFHVGDTGPYLFSCTFKYDLSNFFTGEIQVSCAEYPNPTRDILKPLPEINCHEWSLVFHLYV